MSDYSISRNMARWIDTIRQNARIDWLLAWAKVHRSKISYQFSRVEGYCDINDNQVRVRKKVRNVLRLLFCRNGLAARSIVPRNQYYSVQYGVSQQCLS